MHLLAFSFAPHFATPNNAFGSGPKLKSRLLKISDEDKSKALAPFSKPQTSLYIIAEAFQPVGVDQRPEGRVLGFALHQVPS
jgi:hypothetical protein